MGKAWRTLPLLLLLLVVVMLVSQAGEGAVVPPNVPIMKGLSWSFYERTCPQLEHIIRKHLTKVFQNDIGLAAGILRLHFHDCFVLGCEASVLLQGSASGPGGEQSSIPNLTLRQQAFALIHHLQARIHRKCGRLVSCSDILALAARDSVHLSGGPEYAVPLGRRDSLAFASQEATLANLPPPFAKTSQLISDFAKKKLNVTDVVALSGGHTIGISHCSSFTDRLFPDQDPSMDKTFANNLRRTCPSPDSNNTVALDLRSPNVFDNKYYVDLMNRQGLFTSDQDLFLDKRTRGIVESFAVNQQLFFERFAVSMIKMSQLGVLTGTQGEIRANCSLRNSDNPFLLSSVEVEEARSVI